MNFKRLVTISLPLLFALAVLFYFNNSSPSQIIDDNNSSPSSSLNQQDEPNPTTLSKNNNILQNFFEKKNDENYRYNANQLTLVNTVEFEENHRTKDTPRSAPFATCPYRPNTYKELGNFPFWGKIMNSSFPCPAAGMNNQLTLLLAYWYCQEQMQKRKISSSEEEGHQDDEALTIFKWKDISCSPTGGKDGNRKFVVGSSDYNYAWFRWSEVFEPRLVPRYYHLSSQQQKKIDDDNNKKEKIPNSVGNSALCLHDSYTWKEHPELAKCNSNIGHLYGTRTWWDLRGRLEPRTRFTNFAKCFLEAASFSAQAEEDHVEESSKLKEVEEDEISEATTEGAKILTLTSPFKKQFLKCISKISRHHSPRHDENEKQEQKEKENNNDKSLFSNGVLGLHIRRGDYAHFCAGLKGSSGIRKFRVPPFKWLSKLNEQLSTKFPDTCAPSDSKIVDHIQRIVLQAASKKNQKKSTSGSGLLHTVFIASNSQSLIEKIRSSLENLYNKKVLKRKLQVLSLTDITGRTESKQDAEKIHQIWPDELYDEKWRQERFWRAQRYSLTDKVMLDILILSLCQVVVLNRYSTFSQSVIDERVLLSATDFVAKNKKSETMMTTTLRDEDFRTSLPGVADVKWW
jgi:hypothetical protein